MIDWSIYWRDWFDIREPDGAALIDWSQCPDAESVPDRCGGAWVVRGTRIPVQGINMTYTSKWSRRYYLSLLNPTACAHEQHHQCGGDQEHPRQDKGFEIGAERDP